MIEEDFVSFKTAMLLKEHGFNEKCNYVYDRNGTMIAAQNFMEGESSVDCDDIDSVAKYEGWITYTQGEYAYLCPTLHRALKWLRVVHKIFIPVDERFVGKYRVGYVLYDGAPLDIYDKKTFSTPEEGAENALIYCLENYVCDDPTENKNAKEKIIPFDIKLRPEVEAGKYKVITRDGQDVIIRFWDDKSGYPIVAKIDQAEDIHFKEDGRYSQIFLTSYDLFLKLVNNTDNNNCAE